MQEINLSFVRAVTDSSLAVVAKRAPQLQRINLSNCTNITDEGIRVLCGALKELQEINLANSSITDESVQHAVTHLPSTFCSIFVAFLINIRIRSEEVGPGALQNHKRCIASHCTGTGYSAFGKLVVQSLSENRRLRHSCLRIKYV